MARTFQIERVTWVSISDSSKVRDLTGYWSRRMNGYCWYNGVHDLVGDLGDPHPGNRKKLVFEYRCGHGPVRTTEILESRTSIDGRAYTVVALSCSNFAAIRTGISRFLHSHSHA